MARIPFGVDYASTVEGQTAVPYRCTACGYETIAVVSSKGEAEASSIAFIGMKAARARASEKAKTDLQANAETRARSLGSLVALGSRPRQACETTGFRRCKAAELPHITAAS